MSQAEIIDATDEEYFAMDALDQSQLKAFLKNPKEWAYDRLLGDHTPTDAMKFGTAFHAYLLNTSEVVCLDEGQTFQNKANKAWREAQEAMGNIVVSYKDMQLLKRMKQNIIDSRPDMYDLIGKGTCEQCIVWTDDDTGLELKAKPDLIPTGVDYLVDLKTASSASATDFHKHVIEYGYHIQASFYRQAVANCPAEAFQRTRRKPVAMQFWVFEKSGACDWQPFSISADNDVTKMAGMAISAALHGIAELRDKAEADGHYGKGIDAAARYALRNCGYDKSLKEIEFTAWDMADAQNFAMYNDVVA